MPQNSTSRNKKIGIGILSLVIIVGIAAQLFFSHKIKTILNQKVPQSLNLSYGDLSTNVLLGKIKLTDVQMDSPDNHIDFGAESITVSGLRYWPLFKNGAIALNDLTIASPNIVQQQKPKNSATTEKEKSVSQNITIDNISLQSGSYKLLNQKADSIATLENIDFKLSDITFNQETSTQQIPFTFGEYQLNTKQGYLTLSPWEFITFQKIALNHKNGNIQQLALQSRYSKADLSKKLLVEHDHYDLTIANILLTDWDFGMQTDLPYFHLGKMQLQEPVFHVYRDKLVPDDTSHKKLYNQALRDLPIDLKVDSIEIEKGLITYQERLEPDVEPENLSFTDIEATVNNVHTHGSGDVNVDIEAKLMNNGPFTLGWSFDPHNTSNRFLAKGTLYNFQSESISPFLSSNLRARVKGTVEELYFTISGNELESQGDMKMKYDDFEFTVLKKDRLGVNKILTAVVNLFAKDGQDADKDGYRYGDFKVSRNQDKSFFNYLWINLQEGLLDTMTGRGEKN
ncbi:DUF748 domain-containing protein [Allomuricauda sp. F6463D]|uniref:DUF748 domain-containing protein n=1 Tax=Allomuricauda sp. F6463D TaxID=2926409 RepID=UPI001FF3AFD8|nr:DUF748 domain-containing protein [Muricauda sp. F6463D]MCK0161671.1 DUF748 domain-containing protein [Muricauda sp. F6463D]